MEKPLLNIQELTKTFHTPKGEITAIKGFSLKIYPGEFVSIIGPSGCGKSTVLSTVYGLMEKSSGVIEYQNESIKGAYMLQRDNLLAFRNIFDNCMIGLEVQGKADEQAKNYVKTLLETYNLSEFSHAYPAQLSGGMRQRVALIRTLAIRPDILFLDEPFSALDSQTRLFVSSDIAQIIHAQGKTAILVTHDISEAIALSERVVVMTKRPGKVKAIYDMHFENRAKGNERRKAKEFPMYYNKLYEDLKSDERG